MKQLNDEEAFDVLYRAGFTVSEINRLIQLRRDHAERKLKGVSHNPLFLRFVHWCIRITLIG